MNTRTKSEAQRNAERIVEKWVIGTALTGWIPGSTIFSAAGDMAMIRQVADEFGVGFFDKSAVEAHVGGVIGGAIGGSIASELLSFIPIVGWAVKAMALSAKVKIIGVLVIDYFYEKSPLKA